MVFWYGGTFALVNIILPGSGYIVVLLRNGNGWWYLARYLSIYLFVPGEGRERDWAWLRLV